MQDKAAITVQPVTPNIWGSQQAMDHNYIAEFELIEGYLKGRLAPEETVEFEEHFVDCLQCVDRLNTTKAFMSGLRIVASDRPAQSYRQGESAKFWQLPIYRRSFAFASGVLFLIALAGLVIVSNRMRSANAEADQVRRASAERERRYEEERQTSSQDLSKLRESERGLAEQVAKLRTELEGERKQKLIAKAEQNLAWEQPQVNPEIFELSSVRGLSRGSINEITLSNSLTRFMISLQLEGEERHPAYRMTILDDHKRTLWKDSGSKPNRYNALLVGFNSTFFRPGVYVLRVEGGAADGSMSTIGEYSFRVRKRR